MPNRITINAGESLTIRIKLGLGKDSTGSIIYAQPDSNENKGIELYLLDQNGIQCWHKDLSDLTFSSGSSPAFIEITLTPDETFQMSGRTVRFEASKKDNNGRVLISNLIDSPNILIYVKPNTIGKSFVNFPKHG